MEPPLEARIARLEADVAHLRTDVGDIKVDVRALRDRMDTRMDRFEAKLETLKDAMPGGYAALRAEIASAKIWALLLYLALAATMLGTMARGFGWL